ncbi:MAG: TetR/AcrR family transcriptional regulator [Microthrixaceae bacterium]
MARPVAIDVDDLFRAAMSAGAADETTTRILDAAGEVFVERGIRRSSVEMIAERSGVGRTTVYRRFENRQQIVQAVLGRECHRFFGSIMSATSGEQRLEEQVVEGLLMGLHAADTSVLSDLLRTEPELLRLLTVDGEAVVATATMVLVAYFGPVQDDADRRRVAAVAELLVRLSISWVLTPSTAMPLADDESSRRSLHVLLDPLLVPLAALRG